MIHSRPAFRLAGFLLYLGPLLAGNLGVVGLNLWPWFGIFIVWQVSRSPKKFPVFPSTWDDPERWVFLGFTAVIQVILVFFVAAIGWATAHVIPFQYPFWLAFGLSLGGVLLIQFAPKPMTPEMERALGTMLSQIEPKASGLPSLQSQLTIPTRLNSIIDCVTLSGPASDEDRLSQIANVLRRLKHEPADLVAKALVQSRGKSSAHLDALILFVTQPRIAEIVQGEQYMFSAFQTADDHHLPEQLFRAAKSSSNLLDLRPDAAIDMPSPDMLHNIAMKWAKTAPHIAQHLGLLAQQIERINEGWDVTD